MTVDDNYIRSAQEWSVRFTDGGKEAFRSLGGSQQLCEWSFHVWAPEQDGRTEKELVEEVRTLAVKKIYKEVRKDGLQISLEELMILNSHKYLEGSKQ